MPCHLINYVFSSSHYHLLSGTVQFNILPPALSHICYQVFYSQLTSTGPNFPPPRRTLSEPSVAMTNFSGSVPAFGQYVFLHVFCCEAALNSFSFQFAELSNLHTHLTVRALRPAGSRKRGIPYGYGFNLVSFPNYFFETLAWGVICVMSGSVGGTSNKFATQSKLPPDTHHHLNF